MFKAAARWPARADFSPVAHVGMSHGGSTAAAYLDPRSVAAINLDGSDPHHNGLNRDISVPLLMLHTDSIDVFGFMEERTRRLLEAA